MNKTIPESLAELRAIAAQAGRDGIGLKVSIATAFGCPLEGKAPRHTCTTPWARAWPTSLPRPAGGSVYVDNRSLRIIWKVTELQVIEVAIIAGIAESEGMFAYKLVSRRRGELENFIKELVKQ